jgi:hypothetical protein
MTNTGNNIHTTYVVKIDDDYKIIQNCNITKLQIEKIIISYYINLTIEVFELKINTPDLLNQMIQSNSFFKVNIIDIEELKLKLQQYDDVTKYFNKHMDCKVRVSTNVSDSTKVSATTKINDYLNIDLHDSDKINNIYDSEKIIGYSKSNNYQFTNSNNSLLEGGNHYNIYYNDQFNNIIIVLENDDYLYRNAKLSNYFPELKFLINSQLSEEQLKEIKDLISEIFVNFEDAKDKIDRIINEKVINSKLTIDEIKKLINKYFTLNSNIKNCVKFTNILNTINSEIKVSDFYVNYIKRQLPHILLDIGLQKKRNSDGIYWYGLLVKTEKDKQKNPKKPEKSMLDYKPVTDLDIENKINERNDMIIMYDTIMTTVCDDNV